MIKENSTVFCLGSPEGKRAFFRKCVSEENVYADNDEVFACITEDDKSYFIVCAPPCENLTAEEYFRSNRALISPADFDFSALRSFVFKTCGFILFRKTSPHDATLIYLEGQTQLDKLINLFINKKQ